MDAALQTLLEDPRLWQAGGTARPPATIPAGHAKLAALLPGGGWPAGALTEVLTPRPGSGELGLLLPALAALCREGRSIAWIGAPHPPYAPALVAAGLDPSRVFCVEASHGSRAVWATEQVLQSGACGAVLAWLDAPSMSRLRRLQLAARQGDAPAVLFRPAAAAGRPSPATLRLLVEPEAGGLRVRLLKARGRRPGCVLVRPGITGQ